VENITLDRPTDYQVLTCRNCTDGEILGFDFSMAFQPIVNLRTRETYAQEALVRGLNNEPAGEVFKSVTNDNLYRFDQTCRVKAVSLAARLGITSYLSINFMPNAIYRPELCIRTTLLAADTYGFPKDRIIFEVTEAEKVTDNKHLQNIVQHYRKLDFLTAIDDFGAGYSGLNLLAEVHTDLVKLDMALIRNIHQDKRRQAIVRGILRVCQDLGIRVIAEGIETKDELDILAAIGIELFQGFYFARPEFEGLAEVNFPLSGG